MNKKNTGNENGKKKVEELKIDSFKVVRARQLDSGKVTFDLLVNGITIYGCFVNETEKGDFISLPQRKGNDGKWYSIVWAKFSDADTRDIISEIEKML